MKKIRNFIVWTLVFLGLLLAFDLLMIRSTAFSPALVKVQDFYVDFRGRILSLLNGSDAESIEQVIETSAEPANGRTEKATSRLRQRYLYADAEGALRFADSLDEVPEQFRSAAQPLKD